MSDARPPDNQAPLPSELYDEAYFLTACEGYDEFLRTEGEHLSRRLRQAFAFAAVEAGMTVLDIGCGRGEIVRHVARIGARAFGIDYAQAAVRLSQRTMHNESGIYGIARANARHLPFVDGRFDRVLMFDVVEHLQPWELEVTLQEARRVLKPGGKIVIHTAPNRWYDVYAYPLVRTVRTMMGQGKHYPRNPRALNVAVNTAVHVNEQDMLRLRRHLQRAGFKEVRVWLDTPPQNRQESALMAALRHIAFHWVPFAWFFQREVFAVARR
jgi:cyclopropane fatty-acyl-phospholipid synthase-like methyltransferase